MPQCDVPNERQERVQEYTPHMGPLDQVRKGALVSMADGRVTGYATNDLQARGTLFVKEGDTVYPGMIVGESSTENDIQARPSRVRCRLISHCSTWFVAECASLRDACPVGKELRRRLAAWALSALQSAI